MQLCLVYRSILHYYEQLDNIWQSDVKCQILWIDSIDMYI